MAISSWSRLKFIDLMEMDLFVFDPSTLSDDELALTRNSDVNDDSNAFFLGLGSTEDALEELSSTNASKEWNVRWIVNKSANKPFERGWKSLPSQLADRDWTLNNERIKSALIVVSPGSKSAVEAALAETEGERGPLKVTSKA